MNHPLQENYSWVIYSILLIYLALFFIIILPLLALDISLMIYMTYIGGPANLIRLTIIVLFGLISIQISLNSVLFVHIEKDLSDREEALKEVIDHANEIMFKDSRITWICGSLGLWIECKMRRNTSIVKLAYI